jgi:hypothetical protein
VELGIGISEDLPVAVYPDSGLSNEPGRASGAVAGPWITSPVDANRDP